ncbi:uncharacterized protein zgc:174906 [Anguilla anguilla]|uniref:uncharacterized protein zgc:174906 n=1 Tax=Anguilla anguilla TaxID=7936 RepID=UPI0015A92AF4|nr:uncharacterized protein zgc:174906 [Anguilla anguilla]
MVETPEGGAALLRSRKPSLIEALSADADHVLQHADSLSLLSLGEYRRIKALADPSQKVRDLLDCVIQKGRGPADAFLEFLGKADTRDTFPTLSVILQRAELPQEAQEKANTKRKRKSEEKATEMFCKKQKCEAGSELVTEKQMMLVARCLGRDWKQLGRVALGVSTVRLEQIEEENPRDHVERVFAMLRVWRDRERWTATAARLHALLSADECGPPPESVDFLLDPA